MPLGKDLDKLLRGRVAALMEGAGFAAKRRPRSWLRTVEGTFQIVVIDVDTRSARDGYLRIEVGLGLRYPFDNPNGPLQIEGEPVNWSAEGLVIEGIRTPVWEFRADDGYGHQGKILEEIADYVERVTLPAADRFVDPWRLLLHMMGPRDTWRTIDLALRLGQNELAALLTRAAGQKIALLPTARTGAQKPLDYADKLGIDLFHDDREALKSSIRDEVEKIREKYGELPESILDLERRYLHP